MIVKYYPNGGPIKVLFSIETGTGWSYTYLRQAAIAFSNDWNVNGSKEHVLGTVEDVTNEMHGFNIIVVNSSDSEIEVPTSVTYYQEVDGNWEKLNKQYTVDDDNIPANGIMGSNSGLGANVHFVPITN